MSFTKHPSIVFVADIPCDGSKDRAIAEAILAARQILDQHLTPEQHRVLGRDDRDKSRGLHLALPVDIQIRNRDLFSEMVLRADPGPYPDVQGLNFVMSAEDSAAARQGEIWHSSSDPTKGASILPVDMAARAYKAAKREYDAAVKPTSASTREEWATYWPIVDKMVKAKRMLELAAEHDGDDAPTSALSPHAKA